ncbi:aspartyl-tRNA(Asn)/glutamyl-tRNA(Gln) amidotransferase subunit A [Natronocella acetinitrilica]|uniref:Aspartyl-tRNA(Asn)/glutamyl-tRNA(Gln) amidotransferase subunit A n=1 Tax=Natronocella acetinitrilica TaxID=414046 RepID=A0AAE3G1B2_9GAMM|nr:amidase [Natronocella acetinitrilica]MCP1673755.1 aspartyl-tRNA(Asn)/glutamyl-tRNA(Gln) amidotransferase subunit A [Natronocella acetinitrilica]
MEPLERLGLEALAQRYRDGRLNPVTVAEWCAERHGRFGSSLNAYKTWDGDGLRRQAGLAAAAFEAGRDLGPMQGIPFSAKDLYGVPGLPTYAGSPMPLPDQWEQAGPVVNRLLRQLAPVSGKTHTVEFAYGGLGTNPHWGAPRNPWSPDVHRVPGGSSAGAGVSLMEGSALLALGTDTAGSVRIPASMTGTVGIKLSHGRWSLEGIVPLCASFDTPGLLARSVEDAVWAMEAIEECAMPRRDQVAGLRIGVPEAFFWEETDPGVAETVRQALAELEAAGARLVPLDLADLDEAYGYFRQGGLTPPELYAFLTRDLPEWLDTLDANVRQRLEAGKAFPAWEYIQRRDRFAAIGKAAITQLAKVDVMAFPTVPSTPPTLAMLEPEGAYPQQNLKALRNTCIANVLGLCAITLPVGLDAARMPVGMSLMAGTGADPALIAAGLAVEQALGRGVDRLGLPPLAAFP